MTGTCEFGAVDCDKPAVGNSTVTTDVAHWAEARCEEHLCASYEDYE